MQKGISPLLSPELLKTMYEMGHGDELLLADPHFPGYTELLFGTFDMTPFIRLSIRAVLRGSHLQSGHPR